MKERDGGVDKQRVLGDTDADDPVGELIEEKASNNREQLSSVVKQDLEQERENPYEEGRHEESPCFLLTSSRFSHCCFGSGSGSGSCSGV